MHAVGNAHVRELTRDQYEQIPLHRPRAAGRTPAGVHVRPARRHGPVGRRVLQRPRRAHDLELSRLARPGQGVPWSGGPVLERCVAQSAAVRARARARSGAAPCAAHAAVALARAPSAWAAPPRHALVPGHLATGGGGCAVGMMLQELAQDPSWQRGRARCRCPSAAGARCGASPRSTTAGRRWPAAYPRLHHVEIVFDVTCERLREEGAMDDRVRPARRRPVDGGRDPVRDQHAPPGGRAAEAPAGPPLPPRSVPPGRRAVRGHRRAADAAAARPVARRRPPRRWSR